jgi:hypothetical protein
MQQLQWADLEVYLLRQVLISKLYFEINGCHGNLVLVRSRNFTLLQYCLFSRGEH